MTDIHKIADFYPHLIPYLAGMSADDPILSQVVRRVFRRFCERTGIWRPTLASIDLVADQAEYFLRPPACADIIGVVEVRVNTADGVTAGTEGTLLHRTQYTYEPGLGRLVFDDTAVPAEAVTDGLDVVVCCKPEVNADEFPHEIAGRYFDGLIGGMLADCYGMPAAKWALAPTHPQYRAAITDFNRAITAAGIDLATGCRRDQTELSA